MNKFSSPFAEREYLRNESSIEVFKYLDSLSGEYVEKGSIFAPPLLPEDTQEVLFKRNDRLIDVGLAKVADWKLIERILWRNSPENTEIRMGGVNLTQEEMVINYENVLTSSFYSSAVGDLFTVPNWLASRIQWIAENFNSKQIAILLKNPNLSTELIDQILARKNWCENLTAERYLSMLWALLENKLIQTPPDDDHDYDMSQHGIISGCWMLLIRLENNKNTAVLLAENISKFQEFEVPYSYQESEDDNSGDWKSKSIKTKKKYLKEVQKKWQVEPGEDHSFGGWRWNCDHIRSVAVEKIGPYYLKDLKDFIHSSGDLKFIEGYYAGSYLSSIIVDEFDSIYKKYGASFLNGLIRNPEIFLKSSKESKEICLKLLEAAKEFQAPENMDEWDTPISLFNRTLKFRQNQSSEKYISSVMDLYYFDDSESEDKEDLNQRFVELQSSIAKLGDKNTDSLKASDLASLFDILTKKLDLLESKLDEDLRALSSSSKSIQNGVNEGIVSVRNKSVFLYLLIGFVVGGLLM